MPRKSDIHSAFVAAAEEVEVMWRVTYFINSVIDDGRVV